MQNYIRVEDINVPSKVKTSYKGSQAHKSHTYNESIDVTLVKTIIAEVMCAIGIFAVGYLMLIGLSIL